MNGRQAVKLLSESREAIQTFSDKVYFPPKSVELSEEEREAAQIELAKIARTALGLLQDSGLDGLDDASEEIHAFISRQG